jgi:thiol-disulfide isomerase/thioredoxin
MNSYKYLNFTSSQLLLRNTFLSLIALGLLMNAAWSANQSVNLKALQQAKHIDVLSADKSYAYIKKQTAKPVVVLFSTFNRSCSSCAQANDAFYQLSLKNRDKFKFLFVNIKSWGNAELTSHLYFRVNADHPETLVLYRSKIIRKLIGADYQKMPNYLKSTLNVLATKRLQLYGDRLGHGTFNAIVISDKYDAFLTKYLKKKNSFKAVAVAFNKKNTWAASQKSGAQTQQAANSLALRQCNKLWKNKQGACKLYMAGNTYVHQQNIREVPLPASFQEQASVQAQAPTRIDKYALKQKHKFRKNTGKLAMAYSMNPSGAWTSSFVHSYKTQRSADDAAIRGCEKRRKAKRYNRPCLLYNLH